MKFKKEKAKSLLSIYLDLSKLNILSLVLVATFLGYYLGNNGLGDLSTLFYTLLGTSMTASGSGALNHYLERDSDKYMERTKNRPLPAGLISPLHVIIFGVFMVLGGSFFLVLKTNLLTGFLSLLTAFLYVAIYTPLKKITWLNTSVGSIPGALPIVGGWTAATGELHLPALILFSILFCWQIPHFFSLAIIYKDDYKNAGFKMLPSISENLDSTLFQIVFFVMALITSSVGIYFLHLTSFVYMLGAVLLGTIFLIYSSNILFEQSNKKIKKLFIFSIIYLPLLMLLIIFDTIFL